MATPTIEWSTHQATRQLRALRESCDELMNFADFAASATFDGEGSGCGALGAGFGMQAAYSMGISHPSATSCAYISEGIFRLIRALSRAFCTLNPQWKSAERNRKAYIVGTGHVYSVVPRFGDEKLEKDIKRKAVREIDQFHKINRYRTMQCEKVTRLDRDGDFFIRKYRDNEVLEVDFVEPLLIQDPPDQGPNTNCWYGVQYPPDSDRYARPIGYYVRPTNQDGGTLTDFQYEQWSTMVPVADMQRRTANVDMNSPRGLPVTYALRAVLEQAKSTQISMGRLVDIRARIALIRKQVNATLGSIQPLIFASRAGVKPGPGGKMTNVFGLPYGTIYDTNDQRSMEFPSQNIETDKIVHAYKVNIQTCAAALGLADFTMSGDGSSNFASALVKEGPMAKCVSVDQQDMIEDDTELYEDAWEHAAEKGRLPKDICERAQVAITPPSTNARDRIQNAQADDIYLRNGAMSTEQAIMNDDRDPDVEMPRIEANPPVQYEAAKTATAVDAAGGGGPGGNTGKFQASVKSSPQAARGVPSGSEPGVSANPKATTEGSE